MRLKLHAMLFVLMMCACARARECVHAFAGVSMWRDVINRVRSEWCVRMPTASKYVSKRVRVSKFHTLSPNNRTHTYAHAHWYNTQYNKYVDLSYMLTHSCKFLCIQQLPNEGGHAARISRVQSLPTRTHRHTLENITCACVRARVRHTFTAHAHARTRTLVRSASAGSVFK